jgi:hypothetical protein
MATTELCPICIENEATYVTECNHSYCITCLCKIKKCALCRKELIRSKICNEIIGKSKREPRFIVHDGSYFNYLSPIGHNYPPTQGINVYSSFNVLNLMAGMSGLTYSN